MGIEWEGSEVDDDNPHEGLAGGPGIPVTTSFFFINAMHACVQILMCKILG